MNYDTERQAIYRERQRIKEDANPLLRKRDEAKYPQFADGAEAVVKANGHFVTVVHDNVTTNHVLADEIVEGDVPVRREYKRADLCSIAEYLAQADKKSKKQRRLDDKAADNAYYAKRYFDLLGILLNAPKDATAEDIIGKMKAEAELAHRSLTGEQAKRIKVPRFPKRKGPTIDDARKTILKLKGEIKALKSKVPKTKQPTVKIAEPRFKKDGVTVVGDVSEVTPQGYYWEFRKAEKPYGIKNAYQNDLGVLCFIIRPLLLMNAGPICRASKLRCVHTHDLCCSRHNSKRIVVPYRIALGHRCIR
jgi:hypothetical protein